MRDAFATYGRLFASAAIVLALGGPARASQEPLTTADFLNRMIDLDLLMIPPHEDEITGMLSSYDRASKIDKKTRRKIDWDANNDRGHFLRVEDGWSVMADLEGPGVITRIWSANPHGRLRIILDGKTVVDAPFENLFNGKLAPFAEPLCYANPKNGGKNCYFPISFEKRCKIVVKQSTSYYQINYMLLPFAVPVKSFTLKLDETAQTALERVSKAWTEGLTRQDLIRGERTPMPTLAEVELRPRKRETVESLEGAGVIRALYISLTARTVPRELYALHKCVLRIYFDGDKQPSVEAPLIDFFGSGFNRRRFKSLPIGTDQKTDMPMPGRNIRDQRFMYCFFPMPFSKGFRIEIENFNRKKIGLFVRTLIELDPPVLDANAPKPKRLRFHARFRKVDPCKVLDHPLLETRGAGRMVGLLLNVDCPRKQWWGEGDDKVWIDGERFPSYFGTGTEDYLGDAWGLRVHHRPSQGVTLTNDYGKSSAYRWHILDCINFQKSIKFTLENWQHDKKKDTYYGTIAYWYGEPGAKHTFKPLTIKDVTPPGLRIPGAIEIEDNVVGAGWGNPVKQRHSGLVELSNERAVRIGTTEPVEIKIPSTRRRYAALSLRTDPRKPFGTIVVTRADGGPVGTIHYDRAARGIYRVGALSLEPGNTTVRVQCSKPVTLDCWIATDVSRRSPHAVECEALAISAAEGVRHAVKVMAPKLFSGGALLACDATSAGAWVELELPIAKAGRYKLSIVCANGKGYGIVQVSVNGAAAGEPLDTFGDGGPGPVHELGTFDLKAGTVKLRAASVGKADRSAGHSFALDCIIIEPVKR